MMLLPEYFLGFKSMESLNRPIETGLVLHREVVM